MKEALTEVRISKLPETKEEFLSLMLTQIGTPQGSSAMFVIALNILLQDTLLGRTCLDMIRLGDPMSDGEFQASFVTLKENFPEVAPSYLKKDPTDGGFIIYVKITNERGLRRKAKTVYVGCSGTGAYRPITLSSKPPRYVRKRFSVSCEYENDPWFVTDYPSILLPIRKA